MKRLFLLLFLISILTSCDNSQSKSPEKSALHELHAESELELNQSVCDFTDPDTSVNGIIIGEAESTLKILGQQFELEGDSNNVFCSSDKRQKLGLKVHAGDNRNAVSIVSISYLKDQKEKIKTINFKAFKTEKDIRLGISKIELIKKIGHCYLAKDSTKNSIELNYKIELPKDSKTSFLRKNNMPIYYANYTFKSDKLENIEFGFEYP